MKSSIFFKYIVGYIIFFIIVISGINYLIQPLVYEYNKDEIGKTIYREAYSLSQRYGKYHYDITNEGFNYLEEITTLAFSTDTNILITDAVGNVTCSSDDYFPINNLGDLADYFKSDYYTIGTLNNNFSQPHISAAAPIINNFKTYGYIIVSKSESYIDIAAVNMMNYIYVIAGSILVLSLIILVVFTFFTYIPLKKITVATREYAKGNFDYNGLKIKSHDEIGLLASNVNFMANEIKSIDDKQKKFIANCSHDFRSPLTSIKGYLEAMLDGTIPPELYDKYLNIVLSESERLNRLTSSLLTINTWNNAGQSLDLTDFDIVSVVRNTILSFEGQCNKKKITMDVTYGEKSYAVYADQVKIQQVLYNLIDNAIKFSHTNSTIYISVFDKNDKIFISIKDTGIGIPKNSINKIWDRFYKTDISRGKDKTGSGLGLSIAKEVITSHNENINVISTEGVGTEFTFTLRKSKKNSLPVISS
ncbi:MAG: HAMP domain-containing histidine kinase [Lachnospiraceae bacterium]|nr:HAMP domain-containing histidine kinase [Lachnospiraceae bacterium]